MLSAGIWHRLAGCQSFLIFCCLHTHRHRHPCIFLRPNLLFMCQSFTSTGPRSLATFIWAASKCLTSDPQSAYVAQSERWQLRQAQKTLKPPLYTFTYTFSFHKYVPHFTLALMCHMTHAFCQTLEEVGLLLIPVCVLQSFTANKKSDWQQVSARFPLSLLMSAQTVFLNSKFSALRKYTSQDINKK